MMADGSLGVKAPGFPRPARGRGGNAVPPLLALLLALLLSACHQAPPPDELVEGRLFPELALADFHGQGKGSLDSYRGRLVVLNVWATWCPPCRKELPSLERLHAGLDSARFAVLGVSIDADADIAQEYLLERGIAFTNYWDRDGRTAKGVLGIRAYPDTFVISPTGVLLRKLAGERDWSDPRLVSALEAAFAGDASALRGM
jgi:thiol-disulfide isomerase/thioredoxin